MTPQQSSPFVLRISILHKILFTVILTVFLTLIANTYMSVKTEAEVLRRNLVIKGENLARNIASSTKSAFWSLNWVFVEKMLQESEQINGKEILFSKVIKPNGEVYLANDKKYYGTEIEPHLLVQQQTRIEDYVFDERQETGLLLIHPVLIGKDYWYIFIGMSLNPIREASITLIKRNLTWGGVILFFAIITAYFLARSISKPIIALAQATSVISDGDRSQRIEVNSKDEIGLLSHSFNKMIDSIDTAESALIASNDSFLTVLDSIDATIYVADMETYEIIFINKFMKESFGADFVGQKCYTSFRGLDSPCAHCTNHQLLDDLGQPSGPVIWEDRNPVNGKWYMNHDRAIRWIDGRMVHIQVATDITNLKAMEDERKLVEEKLRQKHKMEAVGTLAGGIAHDFNNVLSILMGNAEIALDELPDKHPARESLQDIFQATARARDLVYQLMSFSRNTEPGRIILALKSSLLETIRLLRATLPTTVQIEVDIEDELYSIKADPTQIHQIVINLCTNAAHAMEKDGGLLQLKLSNFQLDEKMAVAFHDLQPGKYVQLLVSDTGEGVAESVKDRVFDPYFTTKETGKGSGMGLSVVHGIVKSHHGEITLDSTPGKGTTITVYFPAALDTQQQEIEPANRPAPLRGSEKILLVDDELTILATIRKILQRLGYEVTSCSDPREALQLVNGGVDHFDLVITDMTMPGLSGDRLIKKIHQIQPQLPAIICTGYSERMDAEKARLINASAFLEKPILKDDLAATIREILDAA